MSGFSNIEQQLQQRRTDGLYRQRRLVGSPQGRMLEVDGRPLLNFCSNDYLGLANDPRVNEAFAQAAGRWGTGSGASHLVCGHTDAHHRLEAELAEFTGRERCLLFSSGYAANVGTINALLGRGDAVFEDRLNHASLLDGGLISGARFSRYRHRDLEDLDTRLGSTPAERKLVVTDGTFSMDGTIADIAATAQLAARHAAWLMVDEAHSLGVCGTRGSGLVAGRDDVQVLVGTLGKAFGTVGGFVAGSETLIETLIQHARTYIYSTALPAAAAAATSASLQIAIAEAWRRDKLRELIARFRAGATLVGLRLMDSTTPIQPLLLGDETRAMGMSRALEQRGLLVTAIRPPTVPAGTARLRITLTAAHEMADVDRLLEALEGCTR